MFSDGDQQSTLWGSASGAGDRREERQADPCSQAEYEADFSGSEEVRSGIKAGSVFYYLQRQDDVSYEAGGGLYRAESDGSEGPDPVRKRRYELPADDFI